MVATPTLATPTVAAAANSVPTASYTPSANSLQLVIIGVRRSNVGAPGVCGCTDSLGSIYTDEGQATQTGVSPSARCAIFSLEVGVSPAPRTITATTSVSANIFAIVIEIASGFNPIITNINLIGSAVGDPAPTMSAPNTTSLILAGGVFLGADTAIGTPLATSLVDGTLTTSTQGEICFTNGSGPSSASFNTTNSASVGFILEIENIAVSVSYPMDCPSRSPAMLDMLMR